LELQRRADRLLLSRFAPSAVVVDRNLEVANFRGNTGKYLETPQGLATFSLFKMAREGLLVPLRDAVAEARKTKLAVRREGLPFRDAAGRTSRVTIAVVPLHDDARHFLITFEPMGQRRPAKPTNASRAADKRSIATMEQELSSTKDYLQS